MLDLIEFRILDINSAFRGVPVSALMENAGRRLALAVEREAPGRSDVLVVCGPGNNGGDGYAAAASLRDRFAVHVLQVPPGTPPGSALAAIHFSRVADLVADEAFVRSLDPSKTVVVDALLGSGANRPPAGEFLKAIELMRGMRDGGSLLISADVPSGFPVSTLLHPDITVTFHDIKSGMNEGNSGSIEVADIGIPEKATAFTGPGEMLLYPPPQHDSHKGKNGVVTVIGGGPFAGAPAFSSMAAYRTGADLVYTIVPGVNYQAVASFSPNLMPFPSGGDAFSVSDVPLALRWAGRSGAAVIGPGMDGGEETSSFISSFLREASIPLVVDAAAIAVAGREHSLIRGRKVVVTPHAREFERLTGEEAATDLGKRGEQIRSWAERLGITILLKGAVDIISDGGRLKMNDTGNAGMTVGGTGDVLTGIVASLMSKGASPFDAARLGAYINGSAGDISFETKSYGLLATDVIEDIPSVLVRYTGAVK